MSRLGWRHGLIEEERRMFKEATLEKKTHAPLKEITLVRTPGAKSTTKSARASKSFIAECEALRTVRHRNLVKLLTACSSIDFQGNDFKALVYDFMVNGSLEEWLHNSAQRGDNPTNLHKNLDLIQRVNIAIDIACALNYLHNRSHMPIVHCDLQPSNILLDGDMTVCW